ncbi:MAG TPA: EAL domain-containing protein [Clostridiales bacterium]|nr:EAL domain-containing protein [Clostridiales bacterium]
MLGKRTKLLRIAAFIILFIIYGMHFPCRVQAGEDNPQKVLILNSYHQGLTWTKEETEGIMQTLSNEGKNISFYVEYMDWKNNNSVQNWEYLHDYYKYKYAQNRMDLIVATDDAALQFVLEYGTEIFAAAPVVFCGVNKKSADTLVKGYTGVTGVLEVVDPADTLRVATKINPSLQRVCLLFDNSESGLSTGEIATAAIKSFNPDLQVEPWNNLSFEEIKRRAGELGQDSIILATTYYEDATGKILDIDYVNRVISERSSVPVYGLYDFGVDKGILGGGLLSGRLHGENAARLAKRILEGESPDDIPVSAPSSMRTVFDYNQLVRYDIPLSSLPQGSEIINKPFSFYETYKTLVLSVAAAFTLLLVFINVLLFYIRKIRKMRKNLSESHEELTQLYEELSASDEEMRQQYDEIITVNEKIRLSEEKLTYLAYHDPMTGLPNRLSLYEETKRLFLSKRRRVALLFIDIDNLKYVNDTLGHAFGDRVIIKVGEKLAGLVQNKGSLYRLSGDEFVIIWRNMEETDRVEEYAKLILSDFLTDDWHTNSELRGSISIGIALYPDHAPDLEGLLKYADIAMYQAKEAGKKSYVVYNQAMNEVFTERVTIEKYLQKALEQREFEVYYQPQLDIKANRVTGFEALLRWNSPELGRVSPLKFIQVAEDTHCIIPLGAWVLQEACGFLARLEEKGYGKLDISVNISIIQLLQEDFIDRVLDTLAVYHIEPGRLELEITESILMESFERIISKLQILRSSKIKIALDDFGKGYSSLNYLKQLPITTLKVDKSFVDYITDTREDDFVRHIISMGKYLGMCVVAEGVEIPRQLDYLARYDCDKIQGYLFCRPVPEAGIYSLLDENKNI